jgi:hypothetical protein
MLCYLHHDGFLILAHRLVVICLDRFDHTYVHSVSVQQRILSF